MDRLNGLDVPRSLAEVCQPQKLALLVYDMQVGILQQIDERQNVIQNVGQVLEAARAASVRTYFTRHITQIIPELAPTPNEAVLDKLTLSAFAGTPLDLALRSAEVQALAVVGVATEIGIEPTVRHAGDLGFIPVVVTDACAAGNAEAGERTIEALRFLGDAILTDTAGFRAALEDRA